MKTLLILDNLFSDDEFTSLNKNGLDYERSKFNGVVDLEVRDSYQCNMLDSSLGLMICNKVREHIAVTLANPFLRYIKYSPGGFMRLHYDDNIEYCGLYSKYTIIIYLNDADSETVFIDDDFNEHRVLCRTGRLVLFDQDIEHKTYTADNKYIIRTDAF
jgi:hypothetical protein